MNNFETLINKIEENNGYPLSIYQKDILNNVFSSTIKELQVECLAINAKAGSGKSTTLTLICQLLADLNYNPEEVIVSVFGKKNKEDLTNKISSKLGYKWGSSVLTLHALGYRIFCKGLNVNSKQCKIEFNKYQKISMENNFTYNFKTKRKSRLIEKGYLFSDSDFLKLVDFCRMFMLKPTVKNIKYISKLQNLVVKNFNTVSNAVKKVLDIGFQKAIEERIIDFEDMLYVPLIQYENGDRYFKNAFQEFQMKVVMVDECQDVSKTQLELVKNISSKETLIIPVGDNFQNVYSFRGTLPDGFNEWFKLFKSKNAELPVCYRCGKDHIELTSSIFPEINIVSHENALKGSYEEIDFNSMVEKIDLKSSLTYLGISRKVSSLVKTALLLIKEEIPVAIKDKNFGDKIVNFVKDTFGVNYNVKTFIEKLNEHRDSKFEQWKELENCEYLMNQLNDLLACVEILFCKYSPSNLEDWKKIIENIFNNTDKKNIVNLNTIHSAKGLEADVVFFLYPEQLPLTWKKQTELQFQEEMNLIYIALTRVLAKKENGGCLYLVKEDIKTDISWFVK